MQLGVNQMANKVKGIDHDRFGLMPVNVIKQIYKGKDFKTCPCVCFKINRAWSKITSRYMRKQDLGGGYQRQDRRSHVWNWYCLWNYTVNL